MSNDTLNNKGIEHLKEVVQTASDHGYTISYNGVDVCSWDFKMGWAQLTNGYCIKIKDIDPTFLVKIARIFDSMQTGFLN